MSHTYKDMSRQELKHEESVRNTGKMSANKIARTIERAMKRGETYRAIKLAQKYRAMLTSPQFERVMNCVEDFTG